MATTVALAGLGAPVTAAAATPDPVERLTNLPGAPQNLTDVAGTLYFTADDGSNGRELWTSDGTAGGTTLVADIRTGASGSDPSDLIDVAGTLYFTANDGTNNRELWTSDGSTPGTTMVADIRPGAYGSNPYYLTDVAGTLYFTADDGTNGRELWTSDGTAGGTTMAANIRPGASSSELRYLTDVAGTLYFRANDGTSGHELWTSDGTVGGTTRVADIRPGASTSYPGELTDVAGTLYFRANDGTNGVELWTSDGTVGGTTMVADIRPGADGSAPHNLTDVAGTLYFSAFDGTNGGELWTSDGSAGGTMLVADIRPGYSSSYSYQYELTDVAGTLYFRANGGTHGDEVWTSDGTVGGTTMVADIRPGASGSDPGYLTDVAGTLYFRADDGTNGQQLWRVSDMTPPDTVITAGPADGSTIATSSATFSFEGTTGDTAVLQCSLDGGAYVDCTSPMTFPALADGAHTVRLRAIDAAGNIDATPATRSFTVETTPVDTAAPDTTITAGPADGSRIATDSATFSFEGTTGDTARMQCSLDSAAFTDSTSPITFHDLADGAHTVKFRAVDAAGNIDATPATRSFTVETTPVVTPTPDNTFRVVKHGKANTSKGTRKVRVVVPGPGTVRLAPVGKAPVKTTATTLTRGGATVLTIEPTKAGKRTLARKLRRARAEGRTFARIRVRVKFLFIPDGGTRNVHKRVYTLKRR